MPAGHVHPLPPPSHGHSGPLGPPRSTTKYVISPRGCSPSSWLPSPHWLLTLPQDIKSCSPSPAQYVRQQEPLLHGCARWTACFHPTALTKMHGQFPSLCVPPGDPLCRCSRAPPPPQMGTSVVPALSTDGDPGSVGPAAALQGLRSSGWYSEILHS